MELTLDLGRQVLQQQAFSRLLGAELTRLDSGCAELQVELRPELLQQNGFAHGGVVCYLADNALTYAGGIALGTGVVTAEFKINYLRPAIGRRAIARAEVVHAGKRQAVCRCDVYVRDENGEKLVATALGTIAVAGTPEFRMTYQSIFRLGLFDGRVVIVTGGGSGIGRCTAHELASLGAVVALVGRNEDRLAQVAAEITAAGGRASTHVCDIREEPAVHQTVSDVLGAHGCIDGLVNNAGGQFPSPLTSITAKGWDAVVRNNLTGGFLVARECYTQWMAAHTAASCGIVNIIADMWSGMPGMGHSGAARAGMLNFTETAALEWAPVRVNAVAPGWIASSGMDKYPPEMAPHIRSLASSVPLRRLGTESEVAAAIVFLLSPAAAFISGACLRVDGAAPNAKRVWPQVGSGESSEPFNGFHLAQTPKVLR